MLPLRDDIPAGRFPVVTLMIIILNVIVFLGELAIGSDLPNVLLQWAIVPVRYTDMEVAHQFSLTEQIIPFFSSMFMHGGWVHLIGNMWVLWIFGDNVEDEFGHGRYLFFYLLGGIVAGLVHVFTNSGSPVPTIGASGAVAAVMGAYFRFYPHARVQTLVPPFIFGPFFELPAVLFLGFWFFLQFYNGAASLAGRGSAFGGVAWWAHVGGFIFGFVCSVIFGARRARRLPPRLETEY